MKSIILKLKKSKFLIDFVSLFLSNFVLLIIGLASSIIVTRTLGPEGMGVYAIVTTFALLFVSISELGIKQSTIFFTGKSLYPLQEIFDSNFILWILSSFIGISTFFLILYVEDVILSKDILLFAALIIPFSVANSFLGGILIGLDNIKKIAKFNSINGLIRLVLVFILVWYLDLYVLGAIIALILPILTLVIRKYAFLKKQYSLFPKFHFNQVLIRKLITNGFLYGVALFLMTNQKQIPILVMTGRLPEYDIGIYSAGFTFAGLLYNVYNALAPVIFLKSAKARDSLESSLQIQRLMRVIFVILLFLCGVLYFGLVYIIPLFYGDRFVDSIPIIRILFIGIIFYNVFLILNMDMAGKGKPWIAIFALIPVTIINFLTNYFLIEKLGNIGAAYSTSLAMGFGAILYLILYSRELNISLLKIVRPRKSDWDFILNTIKKKRS